MVGWLVLLPSRIHLASRNYLGYRGKIVAIISKGWTSNSGSLSFESRGKQKTPNLDLPLPEESFDFGGHCDHKPILSAPAVSENDTEYIIVLLDAFDANEKVGKSPKKLLCFLFF